MYLGVDLGTSEVKAVLLCEEHGVLTAARAPVPISRPRPLWSEQDPEDWWRAVTACLDELAGTHPEAMRVVRGIGLSGQMHGAVLLDDRGTVVRPAILWNDGRASEQCGTLSERHSELVGITGNLAMPGFTAPKLMWLREHEPTCFERTRCVLLPKDYVRLRLTGDLATDCSDASGTLWLDVARRAWSDEALAACGMSVAQMPRLFEGSAPVGRLLDAHVGRWAFTSPPIVAAGAGDNAASALGIGAVDPGQGFVSLGTSGVVFVVSDGFVPNAKAAVHAFCHGLPDRWHQMSVMLAAASALKWATGLTGLDEAELLARAGSLTPAQRVRAPVFLPYLSGERTPHNRSDLSGVFHGLTHDHDAAALAWSVIEGVCFGLLDGLRCLALPAAPILNLVGGGSRSELWSRLLADTLGLPLGAAADGHAAAAVGAARLGALASGASLDEVLAVGPQAGPRHWIEPDRADAAARSDRYAQFQALFGAVAPLGRAIR